MLCCIYHICVPLCTIICRSSQIKHGLKTGVPDKPAAVIVKEATPTFVLLSVESPVDDGGNPITRYRVAYDMNSEEFALGECIYCHLHEACCCRQQ